MQLTFTLYIDLAEIAVAELITESFAELSAASQNSRPEERRRIVRTLRALTWSGFENIRPRDTAAGRETQVPAR